jgi:hypothetical protein
VRAVSDPVRKDADCDWNQHGGCPVRCGPGGPPVHLRVVVGVLAIFAMTSLSGCRVHEGGAGPRSTAPECSHDGQRQVDALAGTLDAPSATATVFDLCSSRWDTPAFFGRLRGVEVDPFLEGGTLQQAERVLAKRFDCDLPRENAQLDPHGVSSVDCTIGTVPARVDLQREDRFFSSKRVKHPAQRRVIAYVYPRT